MDEPLKINTLFLALTRPAMTMGVTHEYFVINALLSLCTFLLANNLFYALVWLPIHVVGVLVHRVDHHFVRLFLSRARFPRSKNQPIWGVQSYEAF